MIPLNLIPHAPARRRPLLLIAGLCAGLLAACSPAPEVQQPQCQAGTNVVIFLIDTLRADRLGAYGYARDTSPNLDALAKESVLFERAHSPASWTLPSVASLMLGSFLPEHGVVKDGDRIPAADTTLAEHLRGLGYSTGSFIHNPYAGSMTGLERGFDVCEQADRVVGSEQLRRWLDAEPKHPFLLYLHNTIPHDPYRPEKRYLEHFGEVPSRAIDEIEELQADYRQLTRENFAPWKEAQGIDNSEEQRALIERLAEHQQAIDDLYDGEVRKVDQVLGEVIELLKLRGEWENTIFVVLADHGEELGDHGGWEHDHSLYEELIHVPLMIRLPAAQEAGRRIAGSVSLVDVLPTLMQLLGAPLASTETDGRSLEPAMRGAPLDSGPRVTSYRLNQKKRYTPYRNARGEENMVICEGSWKAIWNLQLDRVELYDLQEDPDETRDLSEQEPEIAARLMRHGIERRAAMRAAFEAKGGGEQSALPLSEEQRERLRALGYMGDED